MKTPSTSKRATHHASRLLIVDDKHIDSEKFTAMGFDAQFQYPSQLAESDIDVAQIVLMDLQMGEETSDTFIGRHLDGLSMIESIRNYLRQRSDGNPRAMILWSGHLEDVLRENVKNREHVIARQYDVDWVFRKGGGELKRMEPKLKSISAALLRLSQNLPANPDDLDGVLQSLLGISSKKNWFYLAWEEIDQRDPPLSELVQSGVPELIYDPTSLLRWLLHVVLPFPGFLIDKLSVSVRLGVTETSLSGVLRKKPKTKLSGLLDAAKYTGILDSFMGPRFWKAGIDQIVWDLTDGNPFDSELVRKSLSKAAGIELDSLKFQDPVRVVNEDFILTDEVIDLDSAVQIQPDDWPPEIERPWIKIDTARVNPRIRAIVANRDEAKLEGA